jgi:hypothetical protein
MRILPSKKCARILMQRLNPAEVGWVADRRMADTHRSCLQTIRWPSVQSLA